MKASLTLLIVTASIWLVAKWLITLHKIGKTTSEKDALEIIEKDRIKPEFKIGRLKIPFRWIECLMRRLSK